MESKAPKIGTKILIISNVGMRYEGRLHSVNPVDCTISMVDVITKSSEENPELQNKTIYPYILFRGSDLVDVKVLDESTELPKSSSKLPAKVESVAAATFNDVKVQHNTAALVAPNAMKTESLKASDDQLSQRAIYGGLPNKQLLPLLPSMKKLSLSSSAHPNESNNDEKTSGLEQLSSTKSTPRGILVLPKDQVEKANLATAAVNEFFCNKVQRKPKTELPLILGCRMGKAELYGDIAAQSKGIRIYHQKAINMQEEFDFVGPTKNFERYRFKTADANTKSLETYDKKKCFYDSISNNANGYNGGEKANWRKELNMNRQTFGANLRSRFFTAGQQNRSVNKKRETDHFYNFRSYNRHNRGDVKEAAKPSSENVVNVADNNKKPKKGQGAGIKERKVDTTTAPAVKYYQGTRLFRKKQTLKEINEK